MSFAVVLCFILYNNGVIDGLQAIVLLAVALTSFAIETYMNRADSKIIDGLLEHQCIITSILGRIRNGE